MKNSIKFQLIFILLFAALSSFAQQWGDYTLYSNQNATVTYLMDTTKTNVKTWTHTGYKTGYSSYLAPGGYLYKTIAKSGVSFTGGPICGQVLKMDWNGNVVWDFTYSTTDYCSHHDFHVMPNGNVLLIAYERHTAAEVAAMGGSYSGEVWADHVVEIKQTGATTGEIVWKWSIWDHMLQTTDQAKPNYASSAYSNPSRLNINYKLTKDWIHMNGIDYNPILDQIIVSSHNLNEWWVIDHSTTTAQAASSTGGNAGKGGDILFRWGNPAAYGASGTTILNVTHDAHWIPEGVPNAGRIVGFNNKGVSSTKSAVDQIVPPLVEYNYTRAENAAFEPATYTERHACNGGTTNMGNSNQLPNGNQLVCLALSGTIYEINSAGTTLWTKSTGGSCPQAQKYSKCYVENGAPAIPVISQNGNQLVAPDADTWQWYRNGVLLTDKTSKTLDVSDSATYVVRITTSSTCVYSYSTGFKPGSASPTGVSEASWVNSLNVFPNPAREIVYVQLLNGTPEKLELYSLNGVLLTSANQTNELSLAGIQPGIHILTIQGADGSSVSRKLVINP